MNEMQEAKLQEYIQDLIANYILEIDLEFMVDELVDEGLIKDKDEEKETAGNMLWTEFRKFINN